MVTLYGTVIDNCFFASKHIGKVELGDSCIALANEISMAIHNGTIDNNQENENYTSPDFVYMRAHAFEVDEDTCGNLLVRVAGNTRFRKFDYNHVFIIQ